MKKFILGYEKPEDDFLTEYNSVEEANNCSEEWVMVEANTLEEAKARYEIAFDEWQSRPPLIMGYE
jgi:hypothetical protein